MTAWLQRYYRTAPATLAIVLACVAAWLVTVIQSRSLTGSFYDSALAYSWTLFGPDVVAGGWLKPLGAMFMHLDAGHLAVNMILLVLIGREVESVYGTGLYLLAYLAGGLGAAASVLWMSFETPTVGASGALYALMVLLIGVYRARGMDLRAPVVLVLANLVYTVMSPEVSLWGHVGGLIAGAAMLPFINSRRPWARWLGVLAVLVLSAGLISLSAAHWG